jgi:hypothetical protein
MINETASHMWQEHGKRADSGNYEVCGRILGAVTLQRVSWKREELRVGLKWRGMG